MTDKKVPSLAEVFANRTPSEVEKRLAEQKKPGYIPAGYESFIMRHLPANDPRRQAWLQACVNNGGMSREELTKLFSE